MKKNLRSLGGFLVPFFRLVNYSIKFLAKYFYKSALNPLLSNRKYTNMPSEEVKRIDPGNVVLCEQLMKVRNF